MSPRRASPETRPALIDIAARLLAENGPQALSARRIAAEHGTSTMAVYTHFGGMSGLVRAMVHEGFARLQHYMTAVATTDDPVADMALLGRAYRHNSLTNPHLYAAMFGGQTLAGFSLTDADRQHGRYTLTHVTQCARRCIATGRFTSTDPELIAHHMWTTTHGHVTLELGGYLTEPWTPANYFEHQLITSMIGAGDHPTTARKSVSSSLARFPTEIEHNHPTHPHNDRAPAGTSP